MFEIEEFEKYNCLYYKTCQLANTDECCSTCIRYVKMKYLIDNSLLTKNQISNLSLVPDAVDIQEFNRLKNIQKNIIEFISDSNNLLIYSENVGNGKTTWSIKLLLSFLDAIWDNTKLRTRALFISTQDYLQLKSDFDAISDELEHIDLNLYTADLVVWDDVGIRALNSREQTLLGTIIDKRLRLGLSNIYTTNLGAEQLKLNLGERLYSRIYNASTVIQLKGLDKRGVSKW